MICELFGLPGAGKSYACEYIEKKKYAKNITNFYKEEFCGKVIFHLFLKFFKLNREMKKMYGQVCEILENPINYKNNINVDIKVENYVKYMIFINFIERNYKNRNIIIDEGIIHYCIVLHVEFSVELEKIEQIINLFSIPNKKIIIGLKCSKEVAIQQMKKRNRKRTAIDFLNDEEIEKILEKYIESINYFSKKFKLLTLNELENEIKKEIESD